VSLPLQEANSPAPTAESGATGSYRILIADSNPLHQSLLEGFLERDGVIVETCDTLEDALDSARRRRPAGLFLDCALLGSDPQAAMQAAMSLADAADGARLVARLGAALIEAPMLRLAGFDDVIEGEFDAALIASQLQRDESKLAAAG
jgi:CheY-like chemotaxis protein